MTGLPPPLSADEFASLLKVGTSGDANEISQLHGERLVALGYAVRRLGELGLTPSGSRRLAAGK